MDVHTLVDIELPVFTTFLLAGIGYLIRESVRSRKETSTKLIDLKNAVESVTTRVLVNRETLHDLRRDVDGLKRTVPQISENLAVLTAEFNSHEEWHERNRRTS